jgi:hypothetical protein
MLSAALTAMTGGLAGSLLTLFTQGVWSWWKRSRLEVLFDENVEGCLINTNTLGGVEDVQRYLRMKVRNAGRSTARDVSMWVTNLSFEAPGFGKTIFREDVLDLKVAMTEDQTVFRLAAGAHQYIDLIHAQKGAGLATDFVPTPVRLQRLGLRAGTYRAEVFVSADNAASVHHSVSWSWDGGFPGRSEALPRCCVHLWAACLTRLS